MSTATPTTTPVGMQASLPARVTVRWYQFAVIVLGLALAAVTTLVVYLAVNNPSAVPSTFETGPSETGTEQPCWQSQVPC